MKTYDYNYYGKTYKIMVEYAKYNNNDSLAVILNTECEEEGFEGQIEEFGVASVNLGESCFLDENECYIDTNNLEGIEEFLVSNGLAEKVNGRVAHSGWCSYPLYRFKSIVNEVDNDEVYDEEIEA